MTDLWNYEPKKCDGAYCRMDCDHCPKQWEEDEEEEEEADE